jgi:hypothetical protein
LLVVKSLQKLKTRIVQQNMPSAIKRLQDIFLESFPVGILIVYVTSKSSGANNPGIGEKIFKTLKNKKDEFRQEMLRAARYQKSSKKFKAKKNLPSRAIITDRVLMQLKSKLAEETLKFRVKLLQQCNLKTLRKNYKESNIRQV